MSEWPRNSFARVREAPVFFGKLSLDFEGCKSELLPAWVPAFFPVVLSLQVCSL
jgi:hypothetical protein